MSHETSCLRTFKEKGFFGAIKAKSPLYQGALRIGFVGTLLGAFLPTAAGPEIGLVVGMFIGTVLMLATGSDAGREE